MADAKGKGSSNGRLCLKDVKNSCCDVEETKVPLWCGSVDFDTLCRNRVKDEFCTMEIYSVHCGAKL